MNACLRALVCKPRRVVAVATAVFADDVDAPRAVAEAAADHTAFASRLAAALTCDADDAISARLCLASERGPGVQNCRVFLAEGGLGFGP